MIRWICIRTFKIKIDDSVTAKRKFLKIFVHSRLSSLPRKKKKKKKKKNPPKPRAPTTVGLKETALPDMEEKQNDNTSKSVWREKQNKFTYNQYSSLALTESLVNTEVLSLLS